MENMPHNVQEVSRLVGDFMDPKGAHAQGWQMMNRDNDEVDEGRNSVTDYWFHLWLHCNSLRIGAGFWLWNHVDTLLMLTSINASA